MEPKKITFTATADIDQRIPLRFKGFDANRNPVEETVLVDLETYELLFGKQDCTVSIGVVGSD